MNSCRRDDKSSQKGTWLGLRDPFLDDASPSVRLSVRLFVTEVHWRIIANLGFKFRSHFTAHCGGRAACSMAARRVVCSTAARRAACTGGSSRTMLASARLSCCMCNCWLRKISPRYACNWLHSAYSVIWLILHEVASRSPSPLADIVVGGKKEKY